MSVIPTQSGEFDDIATLVMGEAFDRACKSLRNFGSTRTVREIIATRIIDAARNGERDPARLHQQFIPFGIEDMSTPVVSVGRDSPIIAYASVTRAAWRSSAPALCNPSPSIEAGRQRQRVEVAFRESYGAFYANN
jgi:hypothetical protein